MSFDIDSGIIILFLIINFSVGLFYSRGKTSLSEYAVGDKKFSTGTVAATVIATCIGGGFFCRGRDARSQWRATFWQLTWFGQHCRTAYLALCTA